MLIRCPAAATLRCTTSHVVHARHVAPFSTSASTSRPQQQQQQFEQIRALIIGSPGSGKGTLSSRLLKVTPSLRYLSAGDVLRDEIAKGSSIGQEADKVIRKGGLMPDSVMMKMISEKVEHLGKQTSWLLDGFPRTGGQARLFDESIIPIKQGLNMIIHLDVPDDIVLSRILDRWIHQPSGRTYNTRFNPPKVQGKDDVTGEELVKRSDDDADTFKARLESFRASTQPMIDYYAQNHPDYYTRLQGTSSDEIWPKMLDVFKRRFSSAVQEG